MRLRRLPTARGRWAGPSLPPKIPSWTRHSPRASICCSAPVPARAPPQGLPTLGRISIRRPFKMLTPTPGTTYTRRYTWTTCAHSKQTESGDDATTERETEAHTVQGGWRLEHHPGKGDDVLKADTAHPTPPHSQLNPPAGGNGGRTHATLSSPRGTKAWDLRKP